MAHYALKIEDCTYISFENEKKVYWLSLKSIIRLGINMDTDWFILQDHQNEVVQGCFIILMPVAGAIQCSLP